jgi:hypothetical protein
MTSHRHRTGRKSSPAYAAWCAIKFRCSNPRASQWAYYGGRNPPVTVCYEWEHSFEAFLIDVGPHPSPHHRLERVSKTGHYEPGNVRWVLQPGRKRHRRYCRARRG